MSVAIKERVTNKTKVKEPPKYNIWALDNDYTSFDEVVWVLVNAFNMNQSVASELTVKVDREGKAKVNPKPMSKGLAQAQLDRVDELKKKLVSIIPFRKKQIMMLTFMIKEA